VPEAEDIEACRQRARGYASLLHAVDAAHVKDEPIDSIFVIEALTAVSTVSGAL
jgi:hypothetical protein